MFGSSLGRGRPSGRKGMAVLSPFFRSSWGGGLRVTAPGEGLRWVPVAKENWQLATCLASLGRDLELDWHYQALAMALLCLQDMACEPDVFSQWYNNGCAGCAQLASRCLTLQSGGAQYPSLGRHARWLAPLRFLQMFSCRSYTTSQYS